MRRVLFILTVILSFVAIGGIVSLIQENRLWLALFSFLGITYLGFLIIFSERILLRILGATPVDNRIAPELCAAISARSRTTRIAIMPNASPNALLIRSLSSYLVLTDEALSSFSEDELQAAVTRVVSSRHAMLKTWVGITGFLLGFPGVVFRGHGSSSGISRIAGALLLPFSFLSSLFEGFFFSPGIIYEEDGEGALSLGQPDVLARVIQLCEGASRIKNPKKGNATLSFLFLVNPYHGNLARHFDFHPSAERRTSRLNEISKKLGREIV